MLPGHLMAAVSRSGVRTDARGSMTIRAPLKASLPCRPGRRHWPGRRPHPCLQSVPAGTFSSPTKTERLLHDFDDQPSTVTAVAWSTDGTRVGATAYGGIGWHDVVGPRTGRRRRFEWKGSLLALVMSPNGAWACAGAQDATVHLWRLWSGRDLSMSGYPSKIERLGFRHDGRWLAVACLDELTVWDFGGKGPAGTAPAVGSGHDNHIEDLAWDPSGRSVATGGGEGRTIIWATPTRAGQNLSPVTVLESDAVTSRLRWVNEDNLLVGRADGGLVKLAL